MKINELYPELTGLSMHESSPDGASSGFLEKRCGSYSASHYFPEISPGETHHGHRCENLECLTFKSESFDVFVTQDVMEHVLNPEAAFVEIARVLKPGGRHIFTVPVYWGKSTRVRAQMVNDEMEYLEPPDYHSNPVDSAGSLVVTEWGDDLCSVIETCSGLTTEATGYSDRSSGLDGKFLDVFVSSKPF